MKTLLISLIFLMAVVGCDYDDIFLQEKEIEVGNIYDYDFENEIPEMGTIEDCIEYIENNMIGKPDNGDYWQTPEETYWRITEDDKMQGDCEDISLFFQYLLKSKLNIDSETAIVNYNNKNTNHVVVFYDNKFYDIQVNLGITYILDELLPRTKLLFLIPYSESLWMAVNYHDTIGEYK